MINHFFFSLGFALLLVHEMDAVRLREWKISTLLRDLRDGAGYVTFTALRVPIYALLFMRLFRGDGENDALIAGMDVFFVVHVGLHAVFRNRPENRFEFAFSWALVPGAGARRLLGLRFLSRSRL